MKTPKTNPYTSKTVPVTSSWRVALPEGYARIGISRGPPRGGQRGYRQYRPLAPGSWFGTVKGDAFRTLYMRQLALLDVSEVLKDLESLANGKIPALLCFEAPPPDRAWCHRGLVSAWIADATGMAIIEYGHEDAGWGWKHPKLQIGGAA